MPYDRFLTYSLDRNRPVRVLLNGERLRYVNLTVLDIGETEITALKAGRKTPVRIPCEAILAVSYARGDDGDTTKDIFKE